MDEKVVRAVLSDWHIKGTLLTVVGVCVTLAPYIALGFQMPIPADTTKWLNLVGMFFAGSGAGMILGHAIANLIITFKQTFKKTINK